MENRIRVSIGTAQVLGLVNFRQHFPPTTAYLLLGNKCLNNCAFCAQARSHVGRDGFLSRVSWPEFEFGEVLKRLELSSKENKFKRICFQTTNFSGIKKEIFDYLARLRKNIGLPVSISINVFDLSFLRKILDTGIDNLTLPLDCVTFRLYKKNKKNNWHVVWKFFKKLVLAYAGKISTHLILGLGEREADTLKVLIKLNEIGIKTSLFAFTPVKGTLLEELPQPDVGYYRRAQLLNYVLANKKNSSFSLKNGKISFKEGMYDFMKFKDINSAFQTAGCSGCNRPYYNERPGRVMYNYPRILTRKELSMELGHALGD